MNKTIKTLKKQTTIIWLLTAIITLSSVAYQRLTGPTRPVRGSVSVGSDKIGFKLLRSNYSSSDATMKIETANNLVTGELKWRRLKSHDDWTVEALERDGENLIVTIPKQRPAGKVIYSVTLIDEAGLRNNLTKEPVVIRFKGDIPIYYLLPHILIMFISMFLAARTGLETLYRRSKSYQFALWTSILLFMGGIILGPIVQKFAFGAFWTGWPLGTDLTDNKTAFVMIAWLLALWRGRNPAKGRAWFIAAAALQLIIYLIPHSMFGSELDYTQLN